MLKNYKICTLRDFFFQVYITEEVCVITLKGDTIFKEKLTGGLKNDIKNLVNFHWLIFMGAVECGKTCTLMGSCCQQHIKLAKKVQKSYLS